ncbi:MAG: O-methyltransferase [Acidobacteria bacterium]|nr:O-methyltransferase [Acidobacteriota bacterium]
MTEREYIDTLVPERVPELRAMEARAEAERFPIIGPACGHLCYQVARTIGARRVFELGSGFGYSTAFFARAVVENGGGVVHHTVWDQALSDRARGHLDALGYGGVVTYHVAEAVEALRRTPGPFDIVFNDIDKEGYPGALAPIEEALRPGGVLLVDNMLWGGRVYDSRDHSPATEGVRELTRRLRASPRWITSLVPLRDGLVVATWLG